MSYNESLAQRIRRSLADQRGVTEKKMFGGIAFLLDGKMFCGVIKTELMVRVGPERYEEGLGQPHVRPMDFTGRPMAGYAFVAPAGCRTGGALEKWLRWSIEYVACLTAKPPKAPKSPQARTKK